MNRREEEADHRGHRERLRQRFAASGLQGFGDHEALELLLTYAIPRKDVKPLAYALLRHFGGLPAVLEAPAEELRLVEGIGESAAALLAMLLPLVRRYHQRKREAKPDLSSSQALLDYGRSLMLGERCERLYALSLDAKNQLLHSALISQGDEGETAVYPRLIVAALLRAGANQCVLIHNHPDGDARPSRADLQMTEALKKLLAPLDIRLRDHLIIAGEGSCSLREEGHVVL